MTPERRRLVALAAALAPARASALVGLLGDDEAGEAAALTASLAAAPRRTRLAALGAALTSCAPAPAGPGHPLLERLGLEARSRGAPTPSAARTLVRPAAPSRSPRPADSP